MARKRPNGTGSIYQRKDGRWVAATTIAGRRVSRYAASYREAVAALQAIHLDQPDDRSPARPRGSSKAEPATLGAWVDEWLALSAERLRPSTLYHYRQSLALLPVELRQQTLEQVTPLALGQAFVLLQRQGRGKRSVQRTYTVLRTCLAQAVAMELLDRNPMERVPKPRWNPQERQYWSIVEARRFVNLCLTTPNKRGPLFALLVTTGLRVSEALGLTWSDIDLDGRLLHIRRGVVWSGKLFSHVPPKTKAGRRTVSLPEPALRALRNIRSQSREGQPDDPIFRTASGMPPQPSHLRGDLISLCDQAQVPRLNVHGLRHVAAMLALEAVGDPYLVQQRLGHSHVSVTLGIYGYSKRSEDVIRTRLDQLLGGEELD